MKVLVDEVVCASATVVLLKELVLNAKRCPRNTIDVREMFWKEKTYSDSIAVQGWFLYDGQI